MKIKIKNYINDIQMFKSRWTPFLNDHTQISIRKGHSHMIDLQILGPVPPYGRRT